MKKYNLSNIMKRAWTLVKKENLSLSEALKKAWKEAKNPRTTVKMCVAGKETFTVNAQTGKVYGKTYNSKEFLKKNFDAKWDTKTKEWTVDVEKFNAELDKYENFYEKYIVKPAGTGKEIAFKRLINKEDGFYNYIEYTDGSREYVFVG